MNEANAQSAGVEQVDDRVSPSKLAGENIRRLREGKKLSQRTLVRRMNSLGMKWYQATVYEVEHGKRPATVDELFALAICLDTTIPTLLDAYPTGARLAVGLPEPMWPIVTRILLGIPPDAGAWTPEVKVADWEGDQPGAMSGTAQTSQELSLERVSQSLYDVAAQVTALLKLEARREARAKERRKK